ncbi:exlusion protein FxsA [Thioalkalivibrio denitrificans]|uniref:Exlusion protein FxsA n=1 Tax=Thioalkalivibrio denitrificans TaxID=108003 RepID=A0A1V3NDS2_9GAMM|nr:FxsA family protein [Thioalkalivibrio denitrificans]OOG23211.1 exlusion protein FxsA [Thioalkalivibrio denitrificans]
MRSFPILALLFLAVPLLEIYLFIRVGGWIGVWPTIGLVVLTALVGAFLLRMQGLATLARVRRSLDEGRIPARDMLEGVFLVFGGALLLTPGFFTDAVGFACLLPPSRRLMATWLLSKGVFIVHSSRGGPPPGGPGPQGPGGRTIEGEYTKDEGGRMKDE